MRLTRFMREEAARVPSADATGHNICGVLVHAQADSADIARAALAALPGAEIHQESADGRFVVTVEDTVRADGTAMPAALTLATLHTVDGVASAALIYHHCLTDDPSEEMPS
jgi:nitrate reductase NapD